MSDILIIGDPHAKPGVSNERFAKLGKLIVELLPDHIVNMGDHFDMPSLSSFDKGKGKYEGRRLKEDFKVGIDALKKIQDPIDTYNLSLAEKKVRKYKPKQHLVLGNHENRLNRAINDDIKLEGTVSVEDFHFEDFGWQVSKFLEPILIEGITFQHYFTSGSMDRPIGGENVGKSILKRYHTSSLQGHNHLLSLAHESDSQGKRMIAGSVGCYFSHDEDYLSKQAQNNFARGVLLLKGVEDGHVEDFEFISLKTIMGSFR